jgi:uncharacterized protein (DUF1778 family)
MQMALRPGECWALTPADKQPTPEPESTTFNARLPVHMKKVFQHAADLRHQTLSEFVLGAAYDRALITINDETVIRLSARDSETFALALDAPTVVDEAVVARFRVAHKKSGG